LTTCTTTPSSATGHAVLARPGGLAEALTAATASIDTAQVELAGTLDYATTLGRSLAECGLSDHAALLAAVAAGLAEVRARCHLVADDYLPELEHTLDTGVLIAPTPQQARAFLADVRTGLDVVRGELLDIRGMLRGQQQRIATHLLGAVLIDRIESLDRRLAGVWLPVAAARGLADQQIRMVALAGAPDAMDAALRVLAVEGREDVPHA
jgi:hypothetical protein